jgi:uncharacterized membrane protein
MKDVKKFEDESVFGDQASKPGQAVQLGSPVAKSSRPGSATNAELMSRARVALKGHWGLVIAVLITYGLVDAISGLVVIGPLIVGGPLTLGYAAFHLNVARHKDVAFPVLFTGFSNFVTSLLAMIVLPILIVLWSLLLIIPGIMAAFSYAMTFYVMADNPKLNVMECIRKSKGIMYGNRMKLFFLSCRFIGWYILGMFSLGIGFLWIIPYQAVSFAHFYDDIK